MEAVKKKELEAALAALVEAAWNVRPYAVQAGFGLFLFQLDQALRTARDLGIGEHPYYADDVWTDQQ